MMKETVWSFFSGVLAAGTQTDYSVRV